MRKHFLISVAVIVTALACILSACDPNQGSQANQGENQGNPSPSMYCIFDCGTAPASHEAGTPQPQQPRPTADASVPGDFPLPVPPRECELNVRKLPNPIHMWDGLNLGISTQVVCNRMPALITVALRLEYFEHGKWTDETTPLVDSMYPSPSDDGGFREDYVLNALCYPGLWRAEISWNGIKSDGHTPFPNPIDGDGPADRTTPEQRMDC